MAGNGPLKPGTTLVRIDPRYFRPTEVDTLLGDPSEARRDEHVRSGGFRVREGRE